MIGRSPPALWSGSHTYVKLCNHLFHLLWTSSSERHLFPAHLQCFDRFHGLSIFLAEQAGQVKR